jgi:hypothetical protein
MAKGPKTSSMSKSLLPYRSPSTDIVYDKFYHIQKKKIQFVIKIANQILIILFF